jgi:hypothetical protein
MPGSAVVDLRNTLGAALIGFLVSTVSVFPLVLRANISPELLIFFSLLGLTLGQT